MIISVDEGLGDKTVCMVGVPTISGAVFVCDIPKELGIATRLEVRGGRVVCHTESGIEMIVPVR